MIDGRSVPPRPGATGVALCLGASFLGFYAHAGFVRGLYRAGVRPSHMAGCSAGGIVAGLLAAGHSPDDVVRQLLGMRFVGTFFEATVPLRGMAMLVNWPGISGLLSGRKLLAYFRAAVGDVRVESLAHPRLSLAVTNLSDGRSAIVRTGPLAEMMLASAAVPVLFNAVPVEGRRYWDGGISNSLPVDALCADPEVSTVIVHRISHGNERRAFAKSGAPSIATACNAAHQTVGRRIFEMDESRLADSGRRVIHCESVTTGPPFSRSRRREQVAVGEECADAHSSDWVSMTRVPSETLRS